MAIIPFKRLYNTLQSRRRILHDDSNILYLDMSMYTSYSFCAALKLMSHRPQLFSSAVTILISCVKSCAKAIAAIVTRKLDKQHNKEGDEEATLIRQRSHPSR